MGSIVGNPALPGPPGAAMPAEARGVFAVTRHPMMWSIALWGCCHILVYPVAKNIAVAGVMDGPRTCRLCTAGQQETRTPARCVAGIGERRTSYFPFAAIAGGRARFGGFGMHALGGGLVVWLAATWAHIPLSGWAAGIWRWVL